MNFTDEHIEEAKAATKYSNATGKHFAPNHEHNDCIRIAAEWLDAQRRVKTPSVGRGGWHLKHICEAWAKHYVSMNDIEVAATLLGLQGRYPYFNISSRLTRPNLSRLEGIEEAGKHLNYGENTYYKNVYTYEEAAKSHE